MGWGWGKVGWGEDAMGRGGGWVRWDECEDEMGWGGDGVGRGKERLDGMGWSGDGLAHAADLLTTDY